MEWIGSLSPIESFVVFLSFVGIVVTGYLLIPIVFALLIGIFCLFTLLFLAVAYPVIWIKEWIEKV